MSRVFTENLSHNFFSVLGCSWGRFWFLIDEFRNRSYVQTSNATKSTATATLALKRSDERFRQFFWNNFIQEDDTHFFKHVKSDPSTAQNDVVRKSQVLS